MNYDKDAEKSLTRENLVIYMQQTHILNICVYEQLPQVCKCFQVAFYVDPCLIHLKFID